MDVPLVQRLDGPMTPWQFFASCAAISSFGGLIAELRSKRPITGPSLLAATGFSGLTGLVIGLLAYNQAGAATNPYFLLGICGLAGIGGVDMAALLVQAMQQALLAAIKRQGGPDGTNNAQ